MLLEVSSIPSRTLACMVSMRLSREKISLRHILKEWIERSMSGMSLEGYSTREKMSACCVFSMSKMDFPHWENRRGSKVRFKFDSRVSSRMFQ